MKRALILLSLLIAAAVRADDVETTVTMLAKIGSAFGPQFSPDGKRIAFISNMSGSPQVWIVSAAGGWRDQITALDDPVTDIEWSPIQRWPRLNRD